MFFSYFPLTRDINGREIVDIFVRLALKYDPSENIALFDRYIIGDYDRVDAISKKLYGDEKYFWTILFVNRAVGERDLLPMNQTEFNTYIEEKYGSLDYAMSTVKHYIDSRGNIIDKTDENKSYLTPVTLYEYEETINDNKREIKVLKKQYLKNIYDDLEAITSKIINSRRRNSQ